MAWAGFWDSKNVVRPARPPHYPPISCPMVLRCVMCCAASWFVTFTHVIIYTGSYHLYQLQLSP